MLFSLPISILSFFFLWWVPPFLTDQVMVFIYYMIVYTVLQMAFTMYSIPFCSLVMYQSTDESERDAATSFRLVGEAVFAVLSLFVVRFSELITDSGSLENVSGSFMMLLFSLSSYRRLLIIRIIRNRTMLNHDFRADSICYSFLSMWSINFIIVHSTDCA